MLGSSSWILHACSAKRLIGPKEKSDLHCSNVTGNIRIKQKE